MASSMPAMLSLRSSFVPRSKSVSLVAMRRERIRAAVSPSGRSVLSFFAVCAASATLSRSLAMLPVCRSTSALACAAFFVIGPMILRALVGALWHDVRRIVRTIKFLAADSRLIVRGFTRPPSHCFARGQQRSATLYCTASLPARPGISRLSQPPA